MSTTKTKLVHGFQKLLTTNAKLSKGSKQFVSLGLTLAPHKQSGRNVCPSAGHCADMCVLWFAGRMNANSVRDAALARTELFFSDRAEFLELLHRALKSHVNRCTKLGAKPFVRLNTASDLPWERIAPYAFYGFPEVTFYDYTKVTSRMRSYAAGDLPPNYELTYSVSERSDERAVRHWLESGINCSIVVDGDYCPSVGRFGKLPKSYVVDGKRFRAINGDTHDLRCRDLDGSGNVILLRSKGGRVKTLEGVSAGFVRPVVGGVSSNYELA